MKAFISSTLEDLKEHRAHVITSLRRTGIVVDPMEDWTATASEPKLFCSDRLTGCDLCVLLVARRRGFKPNGETRSITQIEYEAALERGMDILVFLLDDKALWRREYDELDKDGDLHRWRSDLCHRHGVEFFTHDPQSIDVAPAIARWIAHKNHESLVPKVSHVRPPEPKIIGLRFLEAGLSFHDRQSELARLQAHLSDPSVRMVCVVGPVGAGKTALVSRLGEKLESSAFRMNAAREGLGVDGLIYFVCKQDDQLLAERLLEDISRLLNEADAKEMRRRRGSDASDDAEVFRFLLSRLEGKAFLLALDNFEETLDPDGRVRNPSLATLIEVCLTTPQPLKLLVTSREAVEVSIAAARAIRTIPLSTGLPDEDAAAMLRDLDPEGEFGLKDSPGALLNKAAKQCDGLPGALQRVAGLLRDNPSIGLAALLQDLNLDDLIGAQYRGLPDERKRVLEALAIYNAAMPASSIAHMLAAFHPATELQTNLRGLTRNFMVIASRQRGTYQLPPSIQSFVYRQIPQGQYDYTKQKCHRRAAEYFATQRKETKDCQSLEDLQPQLEEIKHCTLANEFDQAASVADLIQDRLDMLGYYRTIRELREPLVGRIQDPKLAAANDGYFGLAVRRIGKLQEALLYFDRAVKNAQKAGDSKAHASWWGELGNTYADLLEMKRAISCYEQSIAIARRDAYPEIEGRHLGYLAIAYRQTARFAEAIETYRQALTIDEQIGNARLKGQHLGNMGKSYVALGDLNRAADCFLQAIQIMKTEDYRYAEAVYVYELGEISLFQRRFTEAVTHFKRSDELLHATGEGRSHSYTHEGLGCAYHHLHELELARSSYEEGLALEIPETAYRCCGLLGILALEEGRREEAEERLREALNRASRALVKDPRFYEAIFFCALLHLAAGQQSEAMIRYREALGLTSAVGVVDEAILNLELLEYAAPQSPAIADAQRILRQSMNHSKG
jgi:tetratricopeptide (TPR) repeat protein